MSEKYILDNLNGQEIKELIVNRKMALEDLDTAALNKLFDYETDLLCIDEGDMELINACAARLDELEGPVMTNDEFWSIINKTEYQTVSVEKETAPAETPMNVPVRTVKRRLASKKIWLVAAAIALLAAMATITASAFGFNVFECFREVIGLSAGEKVNKGTITLVNYGKKEEFSTVDELLISEGLNIFYPSALPENVSIKQVCVGEGTNGGDFIQFVTTDKSTYISIDTNTEPSEVIGYKEQVTTEEGVFYVFCDEDIYAVCYYKNSYYYISSDSYENLIIIIENMRENK